MRPLLWTLGVGLVFILVSLVAVLYSDTLLPPQLVVPSPAPSVAAAPVRAPGEESIEHVAGSGAVDSVWVDRIAQATGIPARALSAYAEADLATAASQPGCHLRWNMLAGIG